MLTCFLLTDFLPNQLAMTTGDLVGSSISRFASSLPQGWTNISSSTHPPAMAGGMIAYSNNRNIFLLFGGWNGTALSETWTFAPATNTWRQLHPAISPSARGDGMLVYDELNDVFILFGGWIEPSTNVYYRLADTWTFFPENESWSLRHPTQSPSPRSDSAVAYDGTNGIMLLVGGFDGANYLGDVWYYAVKNDTWTPNTSTITPSPRADGRMVYNKDKKLYYLFGGNDFSGPNFTFHHLGDTWTYNWTGNEWSQIAVNPSPALRDYPILAYDSHSKVLLLFGGYGNYTSLGDVWVFDPSLDVWSDISPTDGPTPRFAAVGDFAEAEGVVFLFSGLAPEGLKSDSWFFRYPPPLSGSILLSSASPLSGEDLSFRGEIYGGSGFLTRMAWSFGDGKVATGAYATHAYSLPGLYTVRLEAEDSHGQRIDLSLQVPVGILIPLWANILILGLGAVIVTTLLLVKLRLGQPRSESLSHELPRGTRSLQ